MAFLCLTIWLSTTQCDRSYSESETNSGALEYSLTVTAGDFDRYNTVASVPMPDHFSPGTYHLMSGDSEPISMQVDDTNTGRFIIERLPAGSSATYHFDRVIAGPDNRSETQVAIGVRKEITRNTITFYSRNRPVFSYYHSENEPPEELDDSYKRGGYIHPVYSPGGTVLTNHFNPEGHPHHAGIWAAWVNTEFQGRTPNFWAVQQHTGRVDIDTMYQSWTGNVHGGFRSRHRVTDLTGGEPVTALNEEWEVHVYASPEDPELHIFDLAITQAANSDSPLNLPEHHYGGLAFRGHIDWNDPEKVSLLTADRLGREDGNGTRSRWVHIGGYSDGKLAGIATLCHPSNYRFPQTLRLHPQNPYFNYAPTQLGDMSIQPGSPLISRYRFVTYDGEPDPELIDRLWNDYAYPPGMTVSKK